MPLSFINSGSATVALASNNDYLMLPTEVLSVASGDGIDGAAVTNTDLAIYGFVAGNLRGIDIDGVDENSSNRIYIGDTGTVFSTDRALDLSLGTFRVENHGAITGGTGISGVPIVTKVQLVNYGTITATSNSYAVNILSDGLRSVNYGTISGFHGVQSFSAEAGVTTRFDNFGELVSTGTYAYIGDYDAADVLRNFGDIIGLITLGRGDNVFHNLGSVVGDYDGGQHADTVRNTGLIDGDVNLGSGADVYRGFGGTVTGTIDGGSGDDIFFTDQIGVVIDGGADYDTVYARADFVSGGNIEMIVLQGSDNIHATGDDGANLIKGNGGNNDLLGLGGNDTIFGRAGDDFLDGGGGKDILNGGTGDDVLFGSLGADVMYGGAGSDTFLFTGLDEGGIGADRDQIRDFSRGEDVIDISELSDPAFTFEGTGGLSGTGPSIAYFVNANGHAIVNIDVDGDGVRDMQIAVFDNAVLTADDFLL